MNDWTVLTIPIAAVIGALALVFAHFGRRDTADPTDEGHARSLDIGFGWSLFGSSGDDCGGGDGGGGGD